MTAYRAPLDDIGFVLKNVAGLGQVLRLPGYGHVDADLVDAVLGEAAKLAEGVLAPLNAVGDRHGAVLENGVVRTAPGFQDAYRQFAEGGWMGVSHPEAVGGQDLPAVVGTALAELWNAANLSFQLCPLLTQAAIEALLHHGTEEQKRTYLEKLVSGRWTGAMCLTEPEAGSDVGALKTRAEPAGDHFLIRGQKIYITYGDHDLTENIVHLVLARLPEAPAGTRGISLFVVPKFLPDAAGNPGRRNDLRPLKLEHKLGINGSPTCVMAYGDDTGAVGWLVGEPHAGMRAMFTMMNSARLAVGHEGLGLAERAYQQALAYARTRTQGGAPGRPTPIVAYPDVRRMLVTMRAQIAAMRALCAWTAAFVDHEARAASPEERAAAGLRVAFLTPIVKAWCTDLAQEIASAGVQVHGGMGFIEETGAAQHLRDAKILSIYEGTNGIQAQDLVGRKLTIADGQLPWQLLAELEAMAAAGPAELRAGLAAGLAAVAAATRHLQAASPDARNAAAVPYLRMLATVLGGCLLARGAAAAAEGDAAGAEWPALARFYIATLLPPAVGLLDAVLGAETLFAEGLLAA